MLHLYHRRAIGVVRVATTLRAEEDEDGDGDGDGPPRARVEMTVRVEISGFETIRSLTGKIEAAANGIATPGAPPRRVAALVHWPDSAARLHALPIESLARKEPYVMDSRVWNECRQTCRPAMARPKWALSCPEGEHAPRPPPLHRRPPCARRC